MRDQILDFEKEYRDVTEIVKKEQIMKSISSLLENTKSLLILYPFDIFKMFGSNAIMYIETFPNVYFL